jgi:hypothetical protein
MNWQKQTSNKIGDPIATFKSSHVYAEVQKGKNDYLLFIAIASSLDLEMPIFHGIIKNSELQPIDELLARSSELVLSVLNRFFGKVLDEVK